LITPDPLPATRILPAHGGASSFLVPHGPILLMVALAF
jgi:hypothetical protein